VLLGFWDRLLDGEIAAKFLAAVLDDARWHADSGLGEAEELPPSGHVARLASRQDGKHALEKSLASKQ
jgi:hypothetical protein